MSNPSNPYTVRQLNDALLNIPRLQREILLTYRLNDISYVEIARQYGLTVHQVERHIARAMYKLDKQLDGIKLTWRERWFF